MKQKLTYFRRTRTFVLSLLLLSCMAAQGQQQPSRMVKGLVKDARTGEPLAGVAVLVRGTTQGTTTGISGEYAVSVPSGSTELEFSFLGYVAKIQKIGTAHTLDVTMEEEATGLQEVVVVGYGVQKKANLTGSVSVMEGDDINRRQVMRASSALQGLSAGVSVVQKSGQPGSDGATIRVRGVGTINNSDALVLVDGVQGSLDALDSNDIESISVLKDAASAAIYGSRAANGVILVTTKNGGDEK